MNRVDWVLNKCKEEFFEIENRTDLTDDQKISQLITVTSSICAGVAVQPIPFGDIFILTPIQAYLGTRIAKVRGIPISQNTAFQTIKEISGMMGLGLLAQQLVIGAYKFIPYWGSITSIPVVFGMSLAIGRVLDIYFTKKSLGQHIDPEYLKSVFKKAKEEGKRRAKERNAQETFKKYSEEFNNKDIPNKGIKFLRTNFDDLIIIASLQNIQKGLNLNQNDEIVLSAFSRYSGRTFDLDSTSEYLNSMSDDQIVGVVSNVKGILHEMEFVRIENSDGDQISAALFPETNHKGFDVLMTDKELGTSWEIQLKTTENSEYVREWIQKYPDGEILVSEEIANEMGINSSGLSNEELTLKVESFVDKIIDERNNTDFLYLIPTLSLLSISICIIELFKRYKNSEISYEEFKELSMRVSGIKVGKFAILITALSIPVINVVVGSALVARVIYSLITISSEKSFKDSDMSENIYSTSLRMIRDKR